MIKNWKDYAYNRKQHKFPTTEEDVFLINLIKNGSDKDRQKAQEELLKNYNNLIYNICRQCSGRGVEFDDLLQSAQLGLLYAATKYDANKAKFSTYSTNWVWQYCLRNIENTGRTIRLPNHVQETLMTLLRDGIDNDVDYLIDKNKNIPSTRIISAIHGYRTQVLPIDNFINQEDQMMDFKEILDELVMDTVLDLFKKDALTYNVVKDYVGYNDDDEQLDFLSLASKYNKHEREIIDILNRAFEIIKENGILDVEPQDTV